MSSILIGCALFDKIKKQHVCFTFVNSKAEYIRSTVELAIQQYKNLNDLQPKILCSYDVETGEIIPLNEEFSFSEYQMPMSKADALAPLGVDFAREALEFEEYKKAKAEKLANANKE